MLEKTIKYADYQNLVHLLCVLHYYIGCLWTSTLYNYMLCYIVESEIKVKHMHACMRTRVHTHTHLVQSVYELPLFHVDRFELFREMECDLGSIHSDDDDSDHDGADMNR